ncbi:ribonuclease HI family protein [Patescibacteria group bacterium]|nr:ribonuclease HI family protein [Patescibacteria group bacterium]MBU1563744.1 ribonuclease HI family protein [Patescibacteria group bacterium]MBU2068407.1 ribonuclease HI family protein [Patescibacteria group bacterium]
MEWSSGIRNENNRFKIMRIIIQTDGGSRGNPGPSAIGVVIFQEGQILKKYGESIGQTTNNQAEYEAVIFALKKAKLLFGKKKAKEMEIEFRVDSELLVKQMNHQYKIKEKDLQLLFIKIWNLILDFKSVNFKHVRREENKEADEMVNQTLDNQDREQSLL